MNMPLVDAALAFSLTMLLVSTIVSQIVTMMLGLRKFRRQQLVKMLKEYCKDELLPVLQREVARLKAEAGEKADAKLDDLATKLEGYRADASGIVNLLSAKFPETSGHIKQFTSNVTHVSTADMLERLRETPFAKEFIMALGDKASGVLDELGRRYEAIGERFTQLYRANTRACTTVVALALAAAINIDSIQLLNAYINNPDLTADTIAKTDEIVQNYQDVSARLEAAIESDGNGDKPGGGGKVDLSSGNANGNDGGNASISSNEINPNLVVPGRTNSNQVATNAVALDSLAREFGELKNKLDDLNHSGLPIGAEYRAGNARNQAGSISLNILGIILTGLLAGLGAPFWYDAIKGLASLARLGRNSTTQPGNKQSG